MPFTADMTLPRTVRVWLRRFGRYALILAGLLCLFWITATSAAGQDKKPDKEVLRDTLPNGLRVVIVRNKLSPVVSTVMNYLVGSDETPAGFPGTAHALEHMMFRGSPGLSGDQMAAITASMGGVFNASTQQSVTQYFFVVPSEDLDVALRIEAIRMRGILENQELWLQERGALQQEVAQDLSNPQYLFYRQLLAAMFNGTPYAHDPLGSKSSFDKTTAAMLRKFHETWYVPNNAVLIIVGDVNPLATLNRVKKRFGEIPAKPLPERPEFRLSPVKSETLRLKTDLPYGLAVISFRMPGYENPDYPAAIILSDLLDSQRGALFELGVKGKSLQSGFETNTMPKSGLGYVYSAYPQGGDGASLLKEMKRALNRILEKGITESLVNAAKRQAATDIELQKNSVYGLSLAWSQAVAVEGRRSPEDGVSAVQAVSIEDVKRVFRKYLNFNQSIDAVLTPEPSGGPVSSKGFTGPESFNLKPAKPVQLPDWAEASLKRISIPESSIHPTETFLPNGLRLIVQQETVSNTVIVYGHVKNEKNLQQPKGKEGVADVLDSLFAFGTTSLDRLAFQTALDEIAADVSAGTDFSLKVLAEHFESGVRLLADNELHPALPPEAFRIVRQQTAAAVAGEIKSPDYLTEKAVKKAILPADDPDLREAAPETVNALSLQDVTAYYRQVFRPDMTTIVVIGAISPEDARRIIETHFGSWESTGPKPDTDLPPVPPNPPAAYNVPNASRVQDKVVLAETLGLTRSDPDYYALQLGNHVLGGGFYATRLYRDLREKSGLVYYVESAFDVRKTRAYYKVEYGCDPSNVTRAMQIVTENLKKMQNAKLEPQEIRQARAMLLREIPLAESSLRNIAQEMISRVILGLPLDESVKAANIYVKLTPEQVQAAFAKWIRPSDLVQVVQGPSPK